MPIRPPLLLLLVAAWFSILLPNNAILLSPLVQRRADGQGSTYYQERAAPDAHKARARIAVPDPVTVADLQIERTGQSANVYVINRLSGPVEVEVRFTEQANAQSQPALPLRQVLPANQRVLVSRIHASEPERPSSFGIGMTAVPGDPHAIVRDSVYSLPVDETGDWRLGQAFNGRISHNDEQNRYAADLIVDVGTPVFAARGGVVMQAQSGFDGAGQNREEFAGRANFIRILHDDGSMALYAHLQENGVLVQPGQPVALGQVIGYSGNTGFSNGPHLHFSVQVNQGMRLVSVPFRMVGPEGFLPLQTQGE